MLGMGVVNIIMSVVAVSASGPPEGAWLFEPAILQAAILQAVDLHGPPPFAALIGATQTSLYTGTRGLNGTTSALLLRGQLGTDLRAPAGTLVHRRGLNLS